jgi:hypothetical protein
MAICEDALRSHDPRALNALRVINEGTPAP